MPRIGKTKIAESISATKTPKLVVVNSSTSDGRYAQMFRIRPSLLKRAREASVGPLYLILEHALEKLLDDLDQLPSGTLRTINAFDMDPSVEDRELLDKIPRRRVERTSRKDPRDEPGPVHARKKSS